MSGWMIVVDRLTDLPTAVAGYPAMTATRLHHAAARDAAHGAQDPQPVALLRLPDPGLLLLAAGRGARAQGGADGHHRARAHPPHLLRLCAGRARGHAQPHHPPAGRPADRLVPAPGLPGPGRRSALRPVRPAAVRLVPLPDPRGVRARPARAGACASWRRWRSPSWARPARRSWRRRSRPMSASPGSRRAPRRRPASRWASCSTRRRSCRPRTSPPSAISSASPRAWGWASR